MVKVRTAEYNNKKENTVFRTYTEKRQISQLICNWLSSGIGENLQRWSPSPIRETVVKSRQIVLLQTAVIFNEFQTYCFLCSSQHNSLSWKNASILPKVYQRTNQQTFDWSVFPPLGVTILTIACSVPGIEWIRSLILFSAPIASLGRFVIDSKYVLMG